MTKNRTSIAKNVTQATTLILIALSVASCSTYPNKFKCDDARGLGCTMLHEVDKKIDSGKFPVKTPLLLPTLKSSR